MLDMQTPSTPPGLLVLARHGESEGNLKNIFTGWRDLPLTDRGQEEARQIGVRLATAGIGFDLAFCSALGRARQSANIILRELGQSVEMKASSSLNERDYGELTGLNKTDAAARWGTEQVRLWRRSFDQPPPGGESLRDTAARVEQFYEIEILPHLVAGQRVLVVAHGNSLRALIMRLEELDSKQIEGVELRTGEIRAYLIDTRGVVLRTLFVS